MSVREDTVEAVERHNVKIACMLADYWRQQGVEIELVRDPTKGPGVKFGPGGLPAAYRGQDAIPAAREECITEG